jgi:hypothetical protein
VASSGMEGKNGILHLLDWRRPPLNAAAFSVDARRGHRLGFAWGLAETDLGRVRDLPRLTVPRR